jgi:hypothetical protein
MSEEKKEEAPVRTDFVHSDKGFIGDLSGVIINQVPNTISVCPRI